jgi:putative transposase
MTRRPRIQLVGELLHIFHSGNNHRKCFINRNDYFYYLDCLSEYSKKYEVTLHAYVLMPDHIHLLLTPLKSHSVSKMMQSIGRRYVLYFNHKNSCTGTLWEGRFKSCIVDKDNYLLSSHHFIESDPIRDGLATQADQYEWSSYHFNAKGKADPLIEPHFGYLELADSSIQRQEIYRTLLNKKMKSTEIEFIRAAINSNGVLGEHTFRNAIESEFSIAFRNGKAGRPLKKEIK